MYVRTCIILLNDVGVRNDREDWERLDSEYVEKRMEHFLAMIAATTAMAPHETVTSCPPSGRRPLRSASAISRNSTPAAP